LWHGHLARVISKYFMGETPMPLSHDRRISSVRSDFLTSQENALAHF
jgi:hypothetical protein